MVNRTPSVPPTQALVCRNCSYDANAPTATHCEVCGQGLDLQVRPSTKSKQKFSAALKWVGLGTLLILLSGAGYFFWKHQQAPQGGGELSPTSDTRLRKTMAKVQDVPKGVFSYGGAPIFAPLVTAGMNKAIAQAHPDFQLRYTEPLNKSPGSGTGIEMLLDTELSFSQSGRPFKDAEYSKAKARGFQLDKVAIAIDGVVFFTHPDLKLPGLSLDQVQDIFSGKINDWSQVGGPNLPVVTVSLDPKLSSVIQLLFEGVNGASLSPSTKIVRDYTAAIRTVAETPGAISYASAPSVITQHTIRLVDLAKAKSNQYVPALTEQRQVNRAAFRDGSYPFTRRLFIMIRRDGSLDEKAGVAYANLLLSLEGQKIIEKAGFVPIR